MNIFEEIKKELEAQTKIETDTLANEGEERNERLSFINEYVVS
ncbi:MAG: hypothetical protein ACOCZQ_00220 [Nanoarchaeota archaeon]